MFGCSYIKQALGAPTPAEFESVKAENHGLKRQLEDAQQRIAELEGKVRTQGVAVFHACVFSMCSLSHGIYQGWFTTAAALQITIDACRCRQGTSERKVCSMRCLRWLANVCWACVPAWTCMLSNCVKLACLANVLKAVSKCSRRSVKAGKCLTLS
eukprot:1161148-Pelagomonas_calceolata.AAC.3